MQKRLTLKDHQTESRLFISRCVVACFTIAVLAFLLIVRLAYLQIIEHNFYSTLSTQNIVTIIPIEPNRGLIYDRNNVLIAKNIPTYSLALIPGKVRHLNETIEALKTVIPITADDMKAFHRELIQHRAYQPVSIKLNLSEEDLAKFYVNQYRFPSIMVKPQLTRYYPMSSVMSNVLGYVGRINPTELNHVNTSNYTASDYIGKVGIEKFYETELHGTVGYEEAEINASGHIVRELREIPPIPGNTLHLTIDSDLQAFATTELGQNSGALVAIEPATGEVLALVTNPGYDPNLFVRGVNQKNYLELLNSPDHPLVNRAIRGLFPPGSTIKPFYALLGLEVNAVNPTVRIYDKGWFQIPKTTHVFHDWVHGGHGWVDLPKAIMVSCDVYFWQLSLNVGMRRMINFLHEFGFGAKTNIDMPAELDGLVPSPEWKRAVQGQPWYAGDTVVTAVGQGSLLITPLQLAVATATLAERGLRLEPHLLLTRTAPNGQTTQQNPRYLPQVVLQNKKAWDIVIGAMQSVASDPQGTAHQFFGYHLNYSVAAKTGTAQVYGHLREETEAQANRPKYLRNNHLIIVFAPVDQPKIAIAVVVEHESLANQIARHVIDHYFQEQPHAKP